jgi:hypothetical protein
MYFAREAVITTRDFQGKLGDIQIWNRSLSDQEVLDLYNSPPSSCSEFNVSPLDPNPPSLVFTPSVGSNMTQDDTQAVTISCVDAEGNLDECYYNVTEPDSTVTQYTTNETITFDSYGLWTIDFYTDDTLDNSDSGQILFDVWFLDFRSPANNSINADTHTIFTFILNTSSTAVSNCLLYINGTYTDSVGVNPNTVETLSWIFTTDTDGNFVEAKIDCDTEADDKSIYIQIDKLTPVISTTPENDILVYQSSTVDTNITCKDANLNQCYYNITDPDSVVTFNKTTVDTFDADKLGTYTIDYFGDDIFGSSSTDQKEVQSFVIDWEALEPTNLTHQNEENLSFFFSLNGTGSYTQDCNLTIDSVVKDSDTALGDGTHSLIYTNSTNDEFNFQEAQIVCEDGSSTIKSVLIDKVEPPITRVPLLNKTNHITLSDFVSMNASDPNLFGCALNITDPSGNNHFAYKEINITGTSCLNSTTIVYDEVGDWLHSFRAEDDHNKLKSDKAKERVKSYKKKAIANGLEFTTNKQGIKVTAPNEVVDSVDATYNEETTNWNIEWNFNQNKKIRTYRIECEEFAYHRANSGYVGHIVCGESYYDTEQELDIDDSVSSVTVSRISDKIFEITVTKTKATKKEKQKSLGGLNINERTTTVTVVQSTIDWDTESPLNNTETENPDITFDYTLTDWSQDCNFTRNSVVIDDCTLCTSDTLLSFDSLASPIGINTFQIICELTSSNIKYVEKSVFTYLADDLPSIAVDVLGSAILGFKVWIAILILGVAIIALGTAWIAIRAGFFRRL